MWPMKRNLNADDKNNAMKRNPRDEAEGVFFLKLRITDILNMVETKQQEIADALRECEDSGATRIMLLDASKGEGMILVTTWDEEGLAATSLHKVVVLSEEEKWEEFVKRLGDCMDARVIKGKGIVLIECLDPELDPKSAREIIASMKEPVVECYYEWEE